MIILILPIRTWAARGPSPIDNTHPQQCHGATHRRSDCRSEQEARRRRTSQVRVGERDSIVPMSHFAGPPSPLASICGPRRTATLLALRARPTASLGGRRR